MLRTLVLSSVLSISLVASNARSDTERQANLNLQTYVGLENERAERDYCGKKADLVKPVLPTRLAVSNYFECAIDSSKTSLCWYWSGAPSRGSQHGPEALKGHAHSLSVTSHTEYNSRAEEGSRFSLRFAACGASDEGAVYCWNPNKVENSLEIFSEPKPTKLVQVSVAETGLHISRCSLSDSAVLKCDGDQSSPLLDVHHVLVASGRSYSLSKSGKIKVGYYSPGDEKELGNDGDYFLLMGVGGLRAVGLTPNELVLDKQPYTCCDLTRFKVANAFDVVQIAVNDYGAYLLTRFGRVDMYADYKYENSDGGGDHHEAFQTQESLKRWVKSLRNIVQIATSDYGLWAVNAQGEVLVFHKQDHAPAGLRVYVQDLLTHFEFN